MTKRATGTILLVIAAWLFSVRYITAAIYGSGKSLNNQFSKESFNVFLTSTGSTLLWLSIIASLVGLILIIWAEFKSNK